MPEVKVQIRATGMEYGARVACGICGMEFAAPDFAAHVGGRPVCGMCERGHFGEELRASLRAKRRAFEEARREQLAGEVMDAAHEFAALFRGREEIERELAAEDIGLAGDFAAVMERQPDASPHAVAKSVRAAWAKSTEEHKEFSREAARMFGGAAVREAIAAQEG